MNDLVVTGCALLAGAVGALAREAVGRRYAERPGTVDRDGMAVVNVLGAFALGVLASSPAGPMTRLLLGSGFLGGFTTFSTWMVGACAQGRRAVVRDLALHVVVGFAAASLGLVLGRMLS